MEVNQPTDSHQKMDRWSTSRSCKLALSAIATFASSYLIVHSENGNKLTRNIQELITDYTSFPGEKNMKLNMNTYRRAREDLKIAWLVAYPFSGANSGLEIMQEYTGHSQGTNYGHYTCDEDSCKLNTYASLPINTGSPNGPFKARHDLTLQRGGAVLVKTYCSGYCIDTGDDSCLLKDYVGALTKVKTFFKSCAAGTKTENGEEVRVGYDPYVSDRIMLSARHPAQIITSRFHNKLEKLPNPTHYNWGRDSLLDWCKEYDNQQGSQTMVTWYPEEAKAMVENGEVPCHAELWRISNFYNQAFRVTEYLGGPMHVVYFEDYDTDLTGTIEGIAKFLEVSEQGHSEINYKRQGDYKFFTDEEVANMLKFFRIFATPETTDLFAHYS